MNRITTTLFSLAFLVATESVAQVAKTQVMMVNATAMADGIQLNWKSQAFTGNYRIFKRNNLDYSDFGVSIATLPSTATNYKDVAALPGKAFEYLVAKEETSVGYTAFGYIYAGNTFKEVLLKGGIVLLIDSTYITSLAFEINRLENDLKAEGWNTSRVLAGRSEKPSTVKDRLKLHIATHSQIVNSLFIIGHVPVPYSGGFTGDGSNWPPPDGHVEGSGNHTGAWPADGYYGDLDGFWTDDNVSLTSGAQSRHHNIPDDGKFDPCKFPSSVDLEVGRVDLFNMPAFGSNETELMRGYFNRNHAWRTGQTSTVERGLIDNNFGGFNLASTGYHNFSCFFNLDSIYDNKDYITEMKSKPYLWSYGCGAGGYTSCNGIGNTSNFATDSIQTIFTILAGSFFGDWDISNNFLKAPLAKGSLASFWGGIPKWYVHSMGLGKHIGFGTRVSMNNKSLYYNGGFNGSDSSVHMALMGDPTLCNRHLPPAKGLTASSSANKVQLKWKKAIGTFDGYAIYRVDTMNRIYTRVNASPVTDTFYTDAHNYYSGQYRYEVRTIKLETTGSGTYYNTGGGSFADVAHINSFNKVRKASVMFYPNPGNGIVKYNEEGLHNFEVYDMMGRSQQVSQPSGAMELDLTGLNSGNYIIRCMNISGEELTIPVIIARQ